MTTREDFEKWFSDSYGIDISIDRAGEGYIYDQINDKWIGYQVNDKWIGYQACAAHYEAELLKRDALIAEKDKALRDLIGNQTEEDVLDNGVTFPKRIAVLAAIKALSLTHDSVRIKQLGSVKEHGGSIAVFNCIEPVSVGTKLYTIVKGEAG